MESKFIKYPAESKIRYRKKMAKIPYEEKIKIIIELQKIDFEMRGKAGKSRPEYYRVWQINM